MQFLNRELLLFFFRQMKDNNLLLISGKFRFDKIRWRMMDATLKAEHADSGT